MVKVADLTLFDPETVAARSTYKEGENGLPPVGIPYVIVNGTIVVNKGEVQPVKPGLPIRFPVEDKGRFQSVEVNKWLGEHAINVPDMREFDDTGAGKLGGRNTTDTGGSEANIPAVGVSQTASSSDDWFGDSTGPAFPACECCSPHLRFRSLAGLHAKGKISEEQVEAFERLRRSVELFDSSR